jgi:heme/copper-type cytochrome/quinol oxidase subunit 1
MNDVLGRIHFWGSLVCMNLIFMPMFIQGLGGMNRRMYDGGMQFLHNADLLEWNVVIGFAAWTLGLFQVPTASTTCRRRAKPLSSEWLRSSLPHEQGCDPQLYDQRDAGETGCDARHRYAGVVHSDAHHRPDAPAPGSHRLRVRDWLLAAVRVGHYRMRGFLNVKSDADYPAYLAEEARSQRR